MNKDRLFDLAYEFRESKIWKHVYEDEMFAVKLSSDPQSEIGYCCVMGRTGRHTAVVVYPGVKGLSCLRNMLHNTDDDASFGKNVFMELNCIHCSLEQKDLFMPEELDAVKDYCKRTGRPFRAPLPQFTTFRPFCVPWCATDEKDLRAIEAALIVVNHIASLIGQTGKKDLGLRPVVLNRDETSFAPEQLDLFDVSDPDEEVTVPLYSVVNGKLVIERIPLPPFEEASFAPPLRVDEIAAKLKGKKQKGVYECEVIRLPEPIEGDPPYFPALLLAVDENGLVKFTSLCEDPIYDPDMMLKDFVSCFRERYPKAIKVRTEETKVLLEEFCRKANIFLVLSADLELLDEALEDMTESLSDDDEDDDFDELNEVIAMLDEMSVSEIRMMPKDLLEQIMEISDCLPTEIVKKVRKAMRG